MSIEEIANLTTPFFLAHKFSVVEKDKYYVRYEYENLSFYITQDWRINSIHVYVSQNREHVTELTDKVIREFFADEIQLRNNDSFAKDLIDFLSGKGKLLLGYNRSTIARLKEITLQEATEYTSALLKRQQFRVVDDAWASKNYAEFIKLVDKIPKDSIGKIYHARYKYAMTKIGK